VLFVPVLHSVFSLLTGEVVSRSIVLLLGIAQSEFTKENTSYLKLTSEVVDKLQRINIQACNYNAQLKASGDYSDCSAGVQRADTFSLAK
jgi:hypothetical protein